MTPNKVFIGTALLQLILQFIAWLITYIFMMDYSWFDSEIQAIIHLGIVTILNLIIGSLLFIRRPIQIEMENCNLISNKSETYIEIKDDEMETIQRYRTIKLKLIIYKKISMWKSIVKWLLKYFDVKVELKIVIDSLGLQTDPRRNINYTANDGFEIILDQYINQLLQGDGDFRVYEEIEYYLVYENERQSVLTSEYVIISTFKLEQKEILRCAYLFKGLLKWTLNFNCDNHKLFIKRG